MIREREEISDERKREGETTPVRLWNWHTPHQSPQDELFR